MPKVGLARIDDRLIHGQVVIKWVRTVKCAEIVICDDGVRADAFLQRVLAMAAPPGMRVSVKSVAEASAYLDDSGPCALLLMKSPQTALALLRAGVKLGRLNVGGMAAGPGTKRLYKMISATPEQLAALKEIQTLGVPVYFQTVPEPEETPLALGALKV